MHTEEITLTVPKEFKRLAHEYYEVCPVRLGNALVYSFCVAPPADLILVARAAREEPAVFLDRL